jgi:hypothetical protein
LKAYPHFVLKDGTRIISRVREQKDGSRDRSLCGTAGNFAYNGRVERILHECVLLQIISLGALAIFGLAMIDSQKIDPAMGLSGVAAAIGLFLLLIASCIAFIVQDRARRILLLRPFGEKKMTSTLRRFVRKNIGTAGYAFTLSDRNYKPSFVDSLIFRILSGAFETVIQFTVGAISANSHRIAAVKNDKSFFCLCRALTQKFTLSYWSFITSGQASTSAPPTPTGNYTFRC